MEEENLKKKNDARRWWDGGVRRKGKRCTKMEGRGSEEEGITMCEDGGTGERGGRENDA